MTYIQYVLRFASREAWQGVAAEGQAAQIHEAGVLSGVVAGDAPEGTIPEPLPGFHVIVVMAGALPASWAAAALMDVPPGVPLFGGVALPSAADRIAAYQVAIDAHVQATARARSYTDAATCAGYAMDPNLAWRAEGEAFIAWRSAAYQQAFTTLAQVQGGEIAAPSVEEFVASLPAMVWPA